ncbi:efflux RND transporter periplasmic adaptor subunit [Algisphaera agarilytica]|uniref:RND family efflux transporter MFP subunit n=1 Tax=Algisphaera agarilytica TaxID=1385975 RepID=A0A7X0LM73_9BACT|nr:efflux RND transporter periplasmic adaptor subunit [Algisphaera agarilytica]MBB6431669.1 RND family efflux transporter MFP subunit [Algisphaera agarilytica]
MLESLSKQIGVLTFMAAVAILPHHASSEPVEGIVLPSKQVVLNAPLPSILKEFTVREGDKVEAEQPLAFMDDSLQQASLKSAEFQAASMTAIRNAELVLEDAQIQVERILEAQSSDAASEWEVRRTKLQAETAAAQLEQAREQQELAKIQLELERARLERYAVLAPFTGRVLRIDAEAGASLTQQDQLLTLVAMDPLEAHFHLPSTDYGKLEVGREYTLATDASRQLSFNAKLITIDPVIDPASQTFRVVFEIDNADEALPSGFAVWVDPDAVGGEAAAAVSTESHGFLD